MNITNLILRTYHIFGLKILKFFDADQDKGSCQHWIRNSGYKKSDPEFGIEKVGSGIPDKHPGSETLAICRWCQHQRWSHLSKIYISRLCG
jgi:hypothetical protein